MNKVESNAIKIAELLGYELVPSPLGTEVYYHLGDRFTQNEVKRLFSYYQGLMPIVFECNSGDIDYPININPSQVKAYPGDGLDIYDYNTEPEFIEALQLACIKYLELKSNGQIKT